jgi:hypothetical protein
MEAFIETRISTLRLKRRLLLCSHSNHSRSATESGLAAADFERPSALAPPEYGGLLWFQASAYSPGQQQPTGPIILLDERLALST